MTGVRLHPEHGLNPTLPVCILCRKEKGEVVLLGAAYPGQAPMWMLLDPEPCADCRKKYLTEAKGVLLVEAEEQDQGRPRLSGRCWVLKEERFTQVFNVPVPAKRITLIDSETVRALGLDHMAGLPEETAGEEEKKGVADKLSAEESGAICKAFDAWNLLAQLRAGGLEGITTPQEKEEGG